MIALAVFDLAGTTVFDDDAVNLAFRTALAEFGIGTDASFVNTVMGLHKPEAIRLILNHEQRPLPDSEREAIHDTFVRRMCDYYASDPSVREIPGATAAFARLRDAGIKVGLNTGFNRRVADTLLKRLNWLSPEVIDASVTSDEVAHGRPHPDMIQLLMRQVGVTDSQSVAKIGDTKVDLEEGSNAGCGLIIGVTTGSYTREQLQHYPHTHIVNSVADVPGLILG